MIRATDLWNMHLFVLRLVPLSRRKQDPLKFRTTDVHDGFSTPTDGARPTDAKVPCMIASILQVFEETTFECRIENMVKTKFDSLLGAATEEAAKREYSFVSSCKESSALSYISS